MNNTVISCDIAEIFKMLLNRYFERLRNLTINRFAEF